MIGLMALVSVYAVVIRERGISFSLGDKKVTILPGRNENIVELQTTLQKSNKDYDALAKAFKKYREEKALEISRLPLELQGTPTEVEYNIRKIYDEIKECGEDIGFSFYMLQKILYRDGTINTRMPSENEKRIELYKHVQKCLSSIGSHNGQIDGRQAATCEAVKEFQRHKNLKVDGIIGKETWSAITRKFEEKKLQ